MGYLCTCSTQYGDANQVSDVSSTSGLLVEQNSALNGSLTFVESGVVGGQVSSQCHSGLPPASTGNNLAYGRNRHSNARSSNTPNNHLTSTQAHNQQNFIRTSTIKLLDSYQVNIRDNIYLSSRMIREASGIIA